MIFSLFTPLFLFSLIFFILEKLGNQNGNFVNLSSEEDISDASSCIRLIEPKVLDMVPLAAIPQS